MDQINTPSGTIILGFQEQSLKSKRPFRLSGSMKGKQNTWIDRNYRNDWYYIFKYLDDNTFFAVHIGFEDEYIEVINHQGCLKLMVI